MISVEVIIGTTYAASTSYIPIPSGYPAIDSIPTTQFLQGADGIIEADVRKYKAHGVQINKQAVKYNVLKLRYNEVSVLTRYAGISERP